MALQSNGIDISRVAGADLSASQYLAVKLNSSGQVVVAGAGEAAIGILQNKPGAGQAATVRVGGASKAKAGGTIAAGADVAANSSGAIVVATAGRTNTSDADAAADPLIGSYTLGAALSGAASGDIFDILILHRGVAPTTTA